MLRQYPVPYTARSVHLGVLTVDVTRLSVLPRQNPTDYYPDDTRLSKALETLAASYEEASFLVPVGAIRAVDCLRALVKGGKALVVAGDKG